ncbi:hypothetical protein DL765_005551 [Monosporascus sp. GIB2]|nr:hypothetical protein DL765_005551 [Monosporascus sp. GIB2]
MAGDGVFAYRHGIAVTQLVLFALSLAFAVYCRISRRNGWFCIGVFSIFRIVGAGCMLGTITNDSDSVWAGVFVCESFGMILIVYLLLEFMQRANHVVDTVHPRWFWYPQVLTTADIGLAIGGFVAASKSEHGLAPTKYTQASFGLFTGLYLIVVYMFWCFWRNRNRFPRDEKLAIACVAITGDRTWNAVKGNSTAYLIMTFITELAIIYASMWTIFSINPPPRTKGKHAQGRQQRDYAQAWVGLSMVRTPILEVVAAPAAQQP